jgi:hypothetical protein
MTCTKGMMSNAGQLRTSRLFLKWLSSAKARMTMSAKLSVRHADLSQSRILRMDHSQGQADRRMLSSMHPKPLQHGRISDKCRVCDRNKTSCNRVSTKPEIDPGSPATKSAEKTQRRKDILCQTMVSMILKEKNG